MQNQLPKTLEPGEIKAVLAAFNTKNYLGLRNYCIVLTMYRAGLRVSEVCKLWPVNIKWENSLIEVRGGKGGKDRVIPMDGVTMQWLRAYSGRRPEGARYWFSQANGTKLGARGIQLMLKTAARRACLEPARVHPHVFRHTYATELLREGYDVREVQQLLGHSSLEATMVYTHVCPERLAQKIRQRTE